MSGRLALAFLSHHASERAPTGAEHSLALLVAGLAGRGHRVSVVVPGPWAPASGLASLGVPIAVIPARACWLTYHDARPWPLALGRWLRWAWPQRATARIARSLERFQPDAVHVNCLPHLRGAAAAHASGRPVVWHLREILPPGSRRRWFAARLARYSSRIVAVSEAVSRWVHEEGLGARVTVIPNGVESHPASADRATARRALGLPEDGVVCGLFGQLVPHKGALAFVEAARRVLADVPAARFLIAGAGPLGFRRRVEHAAEATGAAERFHLLPPQPDARTLLAASDVVCLATRTPDPAPRAVLEAMAAARPIAAFDSGGTREMVIDGETGLLVPPGDVEALGAALARLAADAALRESMGWAGERRVREQFSMGRHIDAMERIFREVVS